MQVGNIAVTISLDPADRELLAHILERLHQMPTLADYDQAVAAITAGFNAAFDQLETDINTETTVIQAALTSANPTDAEIAAAQAALVNIQTKMAKGQNDIGQIIPTNSAPAIVPPGTVSTPAAPAVAPTLTLVGPTSVAVGGTASLVATTNDGTSVQFVSSDPTIATVDGSGTVTGIAVGSVTITATGATGASASVTVSAA